MIRPKDALALIGVVVMAMCAVVPCTLFMNHNIDLAAIKGQVAGPEAIAMYNAQVMTGKITVAVTGGALALTTVVMLVFYIAHYIDAHSPGLGVLKALGYSTWSLARRFAVFGLSVTVGSLAGFGAAWALMPLFYDRMAVESLPTTLRFHPILSLYLVMLPTLAFGCLAVLYARRRLARPPYDLILARPSTRHRRGITQPLTDKGFLPALRRSIVRRRRVLTFMVGFAAFCYADLTQMAFSMSQLTNAMMATMMAVIGITLAATSLLIGVTTVVGDNSKTIAMLRVTGYTDRECAGSILDGYRLAALVGFAIGTAYQYGLLKAMVSVFVTQGAAGVPAYHFSVPGLIASLLTFAVAYESIMRVFTQRLKRIPLRTIMQAE